MSFNAWASGEPGHLALAAERPAAVLAYYDLATASRKSKRPAYRRILPSIFMVIISFKSLLKK